MKIHEACLINRRNKKWKKRSIAHIAKGRVNAIRGYKYLSADAR